MDINNYKFYVRDIGIKEDALSLVLNDVINDIAISTRIFKKVFGFTIEPKIEKYDFNSLLDVYERTQEYTIDALTMEAQSEEQLLDFLNNPENFNIDVSQTNSVGIIPNKFLDVLDIVREYDGRMISILNDFDFIENNVYRYKWSNQIQEPIPALCLCTIIPDLSNINDEVEAIIKPTVIAGLRYFTDTMQNTQNVNPVNFKYQEYQNAKLGLQNKFPTIVGYHTKRIMV